MKVEPGQLLGWTYFRSVQKNKEVDETYVVIIESAGIDSETNVPMWLALFPEGKIIRVREDDLAEYSIR